MSHNEFFHLPSVALEVDFAGDESKVDDLKEFRARVRERLMKCLIADGVAFQENVVSEDWKGRDEPVSRAEAVVDAWILANKYECSKSKDRHSKKVRWVLECVERVTILMQPGE